MQNILVLGGAGYIGSHTVYDLIEKRYRVVVADSLETGHIKALHPAGAFYHGDIRDKTFLDRIFESEHIDAVVHFAAYSIVGESMTNPLKYYDNNVHGTQVLLTSMAEHGVDKIVFSSTAATYGEPRRIPITEDDPTEPTNGYGATKLAMEQMFKWTDIAHGIRYVSLRYFNACGARLDGSIGEDHSPETHLIPLILQAAAGMRENIAVFGTDYDTKDGTCVRDYIHVCDLARAHTLAVQYLTNGGQSRILNLGNGIGFTVKEVIETAEAVVGHKIPTMYTARRAGDPAQLVASSAKARSVLGWEPKYADLDVIIKSAWNWHSQHKKGFDDK